ncbi:MAG: DUF5717 family protein [Herbinix sp.]|nr:DUF5717 family protein [Herbinix sp.]
MKEKIERFSNVDFEYELPFICLSEEEIIITVEAGSIQEGSFTISNSAGRVMKGFVHSSNRQMLLQNATFHDVTNIISYQFNAAALGAGDEIHGEFCIVSDCGELSLPFTIQTEASYCMSSLGKIKDLFQFTNLARMDWSDAKRVFRSGEFERIFLANEVRYKMIYRNLMKSISTSQALEEFLITIRKKSTIRLEIDKTQVEYTVANEVIMDKLTLTKNHWGYAEIRVSTDVPFIQLEQKFLWADRFIGNTHQVSYLIDPDYLGHGNNFGHIYIKTTHQTITVNILSKYKKAEHKASGKRLKQKVEFGLIDVYLGFRLNRTNLTNYLEETEALIDKLPGPEVGYVKDLLKTHLAIVSGKNQLAEELLSDFSKEEAILKKKSVLEYCAYLYLEALYRKDDTTIMNTADTIRKFYSNGNSDWRILWFLLYTDKHFEKNKGKKLAEIKEQFTMGCRSPILYYEAVCIINEEPYLLRELSEFEVQFLNYGIKNWILSKEAAKQYTYLASKKKNFDKIIFNGLVRLYDEYGNSEILSAICCMLIKGMKKSEKYFEWYRLGVEAQLRITELYEYYMYTVSNAMQDKIAQPVLLYFIYNSNLNDNKKAFLYASVIKNKSINEPIYRSYHKKMEVFASKMLEGHYISRDLAVLYVEFLNKAALGAEEAKHLPIILYRHEIVCNNPYIVNVIVIHKELGTEESFPLINGKAQVDIYTSNAEIFFVDSFGNRYVESVEYTVKPLMNAEEFENACMEHSLNPMLLLHLYDRYQSYRIMNEEAIELRKRVLMIDGLSKEHVTYCQQALIDHYYENYNDELLEHYLNQIDISMIKPNERTKYIEYMLIRSFYNKTLEALKIFGFEGISVNRLVKLCSGLMKTVQADKKQDFLVSLCYYVFSQGKYDEAVLRYLINYYDGSTREMFELWQAARIFELECHSLEERLLTQMLFAQSYIDDSFHIFSTYYREVTNRLLVRAFLTYYAYQYLVHDQVIEKELFKIMKRELFYEENDVCLLAWLKNSADGRTLLESEIIFAEYNIQRLVRRGIVLPFFLQYKNILTLPDQILDKVFLCYHADPKKRIFIHYRLGKSEEQEFITEQMPDIFLGIHTKEFVIFYHEELQYYITEESDEDANITESFSIHYDCETLEEDESNYSHINLMLISLKMKDDTTLLNLMEDYAKKEYMISTCFKQIE